MWKFELKLALVSLGDPRLAYVHSKSGTQGARYKGCLYYLYMCEDVLKFLTCVGLNYQSFSIEHWLFQNCKVCTLVMLITLPILLPKMACKFTFVMAIKRSIFWMFSASSYSLHIQRRCFNWTWMESPERLWLHGPLQQVFLHPTVSLSLFLPSSVCLPIHTYECVLLFMWNTSLSLSPSPKHSYWILMYVHSTY